ncbi:hypothetical protein OOU_Y34scaffold00161g14 [Pyricularia oryzae Y34]|uniref:DUF1690-domain-containing protein n=2 Tax=Pyricularia oryzae TaxID=318829 RepID=A0AA97P778_PYRO3|nr:hypothetical protein OOU_Y34scaffold00161g14 [Pyricularia oryzae Y34]
MPASVNRIGIGFYCTDVMVCTYSLESVGLGHVTLCQPKQKWLSEPLQPARTKPEACLVQVDHSVSQNIVESFQSSTETDASRAQLLELQVQARVASELKKLQSAEAVAVKEALDKLSEQTPANEDGKQKTRFTVSKEVAALREKLEEERKKVHGLPDEVESARSEVVRCLREHDRRPLDCWQEVANFKEQVRKLEKGWVDKVVS